MPKSYRSAERHEGRGQGSRHPHYLKGKDIGLWYARKSREKKGKEECEKAYDNKPLGTIYLSESKKQTIRMLLDETEPFYAGICKSASYEHLKDTQFKEKFLKRIKGNVIDKLKFHTESTIQRDLRIDEELFNDFKGKKSQADYIKMQEVRGKLPSMSMKDQIINLIKNNQVIVISGETGCGKTTQIAQFILDYYIENKEGSLCRIVCTQPRRISAISVAERVAQERAESLGVSVGYQIRLEKEMPQERGSILFCTTGVLLKYMESDPSLSRLSHLILDEIHERDVSSDFLITILKDVITFRKDIKVILMSATLNSEVFSKYYNNAPHINIPGFTYPVTEYFLEDVLQNLKFSFHSKRKSHESEEMKDYILPYIRKMEDEKKYDKFVLNELRKPESEELNLFLIHDLLKYICKKDEDEGGILVFVTGFVDIKKICEMMEKSGRFPSHKYIILPLHSQLPTVEQKQIFIPAPRGKRKIIISTNIAETSITIDDITTVIDCGYIKMTNLDLKLGCETLKPQWVSQANAAQRKGRAGRVRPGICYHLFSRVRYSLLDRFQMPEVLRMRLEDVILQLKMLQFGKAAPFLAKLIDPPDPESVQISLDLLHRLGALDDSETLTPLGYHMASLPVGAQPAKMLLLASLFSCLDPILSIAASLGFKDGFQLSVGDINLADKARDKLAEGCNSDHLMLHFALKGFENAQNQHAYCRKYFLNIGTLRLLKDMRNQFAHLLHDMKFVQTLSGSGDLHNINSKNLSLVKGIICGGLYPNIFIINKVFKNASILRSVEHQRMSFHKKSILSRAYVSRSQFGVYHTKQKSNKIFIHDGTIVSSWPLVFFGDNFKRHTDNGHHSISINGTMRFKCSESTATIAEKLRERLNQVLEHMISHPRPVEWNKNTPEVKILRAIMELITIEDLDDLDLSDYEDCN